MCVRYNSRVGGLGGLPGARGWGIIVFDGQIRFPVRKVTFRRYRYRSAGKSATRARPCQPEFLETLPGEAQRSAMALGRVVIVAHECTLMGGHLPGCGDALGFILLCRCERCQIVVNQIHRRAWTEAVNIQTFTE